MENSNADSTGRQQSPSMAVEEDADASQTNYRMYDEQHEPTGMEMLQLRRKIKLALRKKQ